MQPPTSWTLYATNQEAWDAMLNDCRNATQSIVLEQFIFAPDDFGQKLIDVCVERATRGVEVRFLWDAAGSFLFFGSNLAKELRKKGIELLFWKKLIPDYLKFPNYRAWFLRNHRRTLVIDGRIGYTGSMCVHDQMKNWRDTNVRLEGPVVSQMQNAFEQMWQRTQGRRPGPTAVGKQRLDPEFRYETNVPAPGKHHITAALTDAISHARQYTYITTPYFVPTNRLLRAIKSASKRGVDVRIILPERSDHFPTLDIGARSYFHTLLESGVRIFLYSGSYSSGLTLKNSQKLIGQGATASLATITGLTPPPAVWRCPPPAARGTSVCPEMLAVVP